MLILLIGRALINKPSIILADKPTGNKNTRAVIELLKFTARKFNQTLILITHDTKITSMADRVITIKDGKNTRKELINCKPDQLVYNTKNEELVIQLVRHVGIRRSV